MSANTTLSNKLILLIKRCLSYISNSPTRLLVNIIVILLPLTCSQAWSKQSIGAAEIEKLINAMTLEEKIDYIGGYKSFNIMPIPRLGIPEIHLSDGPVGIRGKGKSTSYPASILLASSFDRAHAYNMGKAIAQEARSHNIHVMLGPGMNIYRSPLTGRNFEYLGEDPYLAGQLAKEYTLGMQNEGVMATAKHYVANNQEYDRNHVSSDMDERTLHEIYLPAFKTTVQEGKVASVMTAYNLINGIHASEHDYLNNKVLKDLWGFDGFIVSDWVSTYDALNAAKGGLDLEMPSGDYMNRKNLIPAIKSGELDEKVIDDKVRRILTMIDRFGLMKDPYIRDNGDLDTDFVRQVALDTARSGMVLLKNKDNALPLNKKKIKTVAVVGPNIWPARTGGGGSSDVEPLHPVSLADAVSKIVGKDAEVLIEKGIHTGIPFPEDMFEHFPFYVYKDGKKVTGANAEFYLGKGFKGEVIHRRFYPKMKLKTGNMSTDKVPPKHFSAKFTTYFKPEKSGYYAIGVRGNDGYKIVIDDQEVLDMWRDQGPTNGKYEMLFNGGQEYKVVIEYYQAGGTALLYLGAKEIAKIEKPAVYAQKAIDVAKRADAVIIGAGFDNKTEGEGHDRSFELPLQQNEFIKKICEVNDNVYVVLNAGGNVAMSEWIDKVNGLLMAWYPGQEGNLAAAEILFGMTNPSGKLPISMEKDVKDNPSYPYYFDPDDDKRVFYGESIFIGYRHWDRSKNKPRFPFGFGLSYTTFEYDKLKVSKTAFNENQEIIVSVDIENTGSRAGSEVVQLYVSDLASSLPRPEKELKNFEKVFLEKGEKQTVKFKLDKNAFSYYNPKKHEWEAEPGKFEIRVGGSSDKIEKSIEVTLTN